MADTVTREQYAILSRYGSGMDVNQIVKETKQHHEVVTQVLMSMAGMVRARAGALARQYADAHRPVVAPSAPKPAAAGDSIADMLADAETSGIPRLQRLAARVRSHVNDLRRQMKAAEQERVLRATIATLRDQLGQTTAELRALTSKPGHAPTPAGVMSSEQRFEIRVWAAQQGIECPAKGKLPRHVVEQYEAAHA